MIRARAASYRQRIRDELEAAFVETHTPHEVAGSFAFGVFITTLPTLGAGLLLFLLVAYLFESVSKIALFASVLVLNPIAKWGVYVASFWLGVRILGPAPGVALADASVSAAPDVVLRLVVGSIVLAVIFAAVGYVVVYRLVTAYRRREIDVVDIIET